MRDPEHGDFRADLAPGYGCRVVVPPQSPRAVTPVAGDPGWPQPRLRAARVTVGGPIVTDTLWDADTVRVVADVAIDAGATLTIAPGVRVVGEGFCGLVVRDGDLQACGTPAAPIVFTTDRPDLYTEDLDTRGCWNGITLLNVPARNDSTRLSWCVLEYAKAVPRAAAGGEREVTGGIAIPGAGGALRIIGTDKVRIDHCRLHHNCAERGGAVLVHHGAAPLLVGNLLHDNCGLERAGAILVTDSHPRLVHNTVAGNRATNPSVFIDTGAVDHYQSKPLYVGNVVQGNATNHHEATQVFEPKAYYAHFNLIGGFAAGEGHVVGDPQFLLAAPEPFALASPSPCRDAGNAAAAGAWLPALDLTGAARCQGPAPDLGAFELADVTAVDGEDAVPGATLEAWPNPANPRLTLAFSAPRSGTVLLRILDLRGRLVRQLLAGEVGVIQRQVVWDGRDDHGQPVPTGTYFAELQSATFRDGHKIAIIR